MISNRRTLNWNEPLETLKDYSTFQNRIKEFKSEHALRILKRFHISENPDIGNENIHHFIPFRNKDADQQNIGTFTTALCLETISEYDSEIYQSEDLYASGDWLGKKLNTKIEYTKYIFEKLNNKRMGGKNPKQSDLAIIACLLKYRKYLYIWHQKESKRDSEKKLEKDETTFSKIFYSNDFTTEDRNIVIAMLKSTLEIIAEKLNNLNLNLDPFYLNRCLQFIDYWKIDLVILNRYGTKPPLIKDKSNKSIKENNFIFGNQVSRICGQKNKNDFTFFEVSPNDLFEKFFETIYFLGKYELYRQLSLNLSGDRGLYDVKRLIYSVLIVSYKNKFSNFFVIKKSLEIIFEDQEKNKNSIWPTGQLIPLSFDTKMAVSSIECINDLLNCTALEEELLKHVSQIKKIFDFYAITIRFENDDFGSRPIGWFPPDQRDKEVMGSETAFVLGFIKKFCTLISNKIKNIANQAFAPNFRKPQIAWENVYDSSAVKLKLDELIQKPDPEKNEHAITTSAFLFGPPGTGKSTYASALADKLDMRYLELTPGDFFSGGESEILTKINYLFENMLHLENTVVFIDEVDDLVRIRDKQPKEGAQKPVQNYFDPRNLYVNTLLPRFQELNTKSKLILIMATNNFTLVDEAIHRVGRIDLLIPVGSLSIFGRLKMLYDRIPDYKFEENTNFQTLIKALVNFVKKSKYLNYNELNSYLKKVSINDNSLINILCQFNSFEIKTNPEYKKFATTALMKDEYQNLRPLSNGECIEIENYIDIYVKFFHLLFKKNKDSIATSFSTTIRSFYEKVDVQDDKKFVNAFYYNLFPLLQRIKKLITSYEDDSSKRTPKSLQKIKDFSKALKNKKKNLLGSTN